MQSFGRGIPGLQEDLREPDLRKYSMCGQECFGCYRAAQLRLSPHRGVAETARQHAAYADAEKKFGSLKSLRPSTLAVRSLSVASARLSIPRRELPPCNLRRAWTPCRSASRTFTVVSQSMQASLFGVIRTRPTAGTRRQARALLVNQLLTLEGWNARDGLAVGERLRAGSRNALLARDKVALDLQARRAAIISLEGLDAAVPAGRTSMRNTP